MTLREETEQLEHLRVMADVKDAQRQVLEHQKNRERTAQELRAVEKQRDALIERCESVDRAIDEWQTRLYHLSTHKRSIIQSLDRQAQDFEAQKQDCLSRKREYMAV